ncbi:hypothetical protein ACQP0C_41770 (plasmid) [Nocardia sp. CA-129566]|uniref:hypothetical protein n=1 Tax=Nocardia sp. CA-129566 TaxID=3239976 RepID=UPI003D98FC0B
MRDKEVRPSASLADMIRAHQEHHRRETVYPDPQPAANEPEYDHIVGWWESVSASLLRWAPPLLRRVPRALCGEPMWANPDRLDQPLYPETPYCPACLEVDGRDPDTIAAHTKHVRGYRI